MYKYLRYIKILIDKLKGKIVGVPMFYLVKRYRGYARNRVYNYVLQNNIYLPRLLERDWKLDKEKGKYFPHNQVNKKFMLKDKAYIKYKKVSYLEYIWARWLWKWCDDDSNYDTYDGIETEETKEKSFGTSWDLGDLRNDYPLEDKEKTWNWITRNTYYNANYMFEEIRENDTNNFYVIFPKLGWHFGFIPYTNSQRKGRMVYFSEDYTKVDDSVKQAWSKK